MSNRYDSYVDDCKDKELTTASNWVYANIFNSQYNLCFYKPISDTCKICDTLTTTIKRLENEQLKKEQEDEKASHQKQAAKTRADQK